MNKMEHCTLWNEHENVWNNFKYFNILIFNTWNIRNIDLQVKSTIL